MRLTRGIDDFADAIDVLVVNRVALGLAHFLEDHLLRQLRGDAPENVGRLLDQQLAAGFGLGVELARVVERDLAIRIENFLRSADDLLHRIGANAAAFPVEHSPQVFLSLVILASGDNNGVLHGRDDDLRVDSLLPTQSVDNVIEFTRHRSSPSTKPRNATEQPAKQFDTGGTSFRLSGLEFRNQLRFFDIGKGNFQPA